MRPGLRSSGHLERGLGGGLEQGNEPADVRAEVEVLLHLLSRRRRQPFAARRVDQQIMDARIAERTLLEFHKDGQVKGWSWNSEFDYQFNRDSTTKQIKVPESVVRFSMDPYDYAGRFQLRGQVVYDRENRTTLLGDDIPHLHADVIFLLPWDETPEAYNRWVTIRSARETHKADRS